jgi:hypothetical protein
MRTQFLSLAVFSLAVFALSSCATMQLPADRLQSSEASIRSAQELGAENIPAARLHLQLAKDQTAAARSLAAEGDERALLVLARAEADAELALGLARQLGVHTEAVRATADLEAVRARPAP